jgi:single-stranded DNA-binding protein
LPGYGAKGARIIVTGHVENDNWTDKDGGKHYDQRLIVSDVS